MKWMKFISWGFGYLVICLLSATAYFTYDKSGLTLSILGLLIAFAIGCADRAITALKENNHETKA